MWTSSETLIFTGKTDIDLKIKIALLVKTPLYEHMELDAPGDGLLAPDMDTSYTTRSWAGL